MAQFSTAVKLGDLNDFIAPAQACVVSLQGAGQQQQQQQPAPQQQQQAPAKDGEGGLQLNARASARRRAARQAAAGATPGPGTPERPPPAMQLPEPAVPPAVQLREQQEQEQQQQQLDQQQQQPVGFQQTTVDPGSRAVKVSLNDCLACSGCVTSAETVLLQQQSLGELVAACEDPDAVVVVSVSPQSRASLAALHGLSPADVQGRLASFLKQHLSVALVLDTGLGSALALTEAAVEFVERYRAAHGVAGGGASAAAAANDGAEPPGPLPVLTSACPGWICYAEKARGWSALPHASAVRSPAAAMGALVKRALAPARRWDPSRVYHVTVMPCYDKKLEAARDDFLVPGTSVREVDSSITTGELQELLERYGLGRLADVPLGRADGLTQLLQASEARLPEPPLHSRPGSSGGYAQHVLTAAAEALFGVRLDPRRLPAPAPAAPAGSGSEGAVPATAAPAHGLLPFRAGRNADAQELSLLGPDGSLLLRVGTAYGFRNIQSLLRRARGGAAGLHYAEVMACPSGCLNGGGQAALPAGASAAARLEQLERLFFDEQQQRQQGQQQQQQFNGQAGQITVSPGAIQLHCLPALQQQQQQGSGGDAWDGAPDWAWAVPSGVDPAMLAAVYRALLGGRPGSALARELLHTSYHQREKTVAGSIADW